MKEVEYERSLAQGPALSKVIQETKFTQNGNVMEITITCKPVDSEDKRRDVVYLRWEKGRKWWSESEKYELDENGFEKEYSRRTAKLVEEK